MRIGRPGQPIDQRHFAHDFARSDGAQHDLPPLGLDSDRRTLPRRMAST